jgi:hypothetical protein
MSRTLATIAAAAAILSVGSLGSAQAGGGATSAPSKYNNAGYTTSAVQAHNWRRAQAVGYTITEFSSSSAKTTPKR